jgi:site-specific DNA-methyltransferase (adenine-specific)
MMDKKDDRSVKVYHRSNSDEWETPRDLFKALDDKIHFKLDACATDENHLCEKYYTLEDDSLTKTWIDPTFVNPPYSNIRKFIEKAFHSSRTNLVDDGIRVVSLIPARVGTLYWHDLIFGHAWIMILKGRLQFLNRTLPSYKGDETKTSSAPFPSALIFHGNFNRKEIIQLSRYLKTVGFDNALIMRINT